MIEITLLGTAALFPIPARALTSVFLSCAGHSILFDCGEGTQTAARRASVSLMKTDIIALTHYHGDHILGLPGIFQTLTIMDRTETLYVTGPPGLQDFLEPILKLTGKTSYEIKSLEIKSGSLKLAELVKGWEFEARLSTFKTEHRVPSQGYCFTLERAGKFFPEKAKNLGVPINQWKILQKGQSVQVGERIILPAEVLGEPRKGLKFVFSGDTTPCETLQEAAANADLFICEGTYGKNEDAQMANEYGHMNFAQAAEIAKRANVAELWLTHYSQRILEPEKFLPNAKAIFENTICGRDGMSKILRFSD